MPEEYEVKGGAHDPQMVVDRDDVVSPRAALGALLTAFAVVGGIYWAATKQNHPSKKPSVRQFVL